MQPVTYLFFKGTCGEAMRFYAQVFGSPEPQIMAVSSVPPEIRREMPGAPDDAVMHSAVQIGDGWLYGSDDWTGDTPAMAGCNVSVSLPAKAEAERVFSALSEGGEVRMPLQATFFSPAFGSFTDRYGTRWMIMADGEPSA